MQWVKTILILGFSIIISSCSSGNFLDYQEIAKKYNLPKSVDQGDYPEDDGVLLLATNDIKMELYSSTVTTDETVHRMRKLFKNIEAYSFVEIPIYYGERISKISARTIKPDGSFIIVKPEEFFESTGEGSGSVFYSDRKSIKFTFPAIEKNCIVEYEYTKSKSRAFLTDVWYVHDELPTLYNRYSLSIPKILVQSEVNGGAGWNWNFKAYNYFIDKPQVEEQFAQKDLGKDKVTYNWTLTNIEPIKPEIMMPPMDDFFGYVKFAPFDWKKWNDISDWYYKSLFEPRLNITSEIRALAEKLTAGVEGKTEKIRRLYDYVKNIRYVAISLGTGSIQPSAPADVLARQYGDCKDKSILLISLLQAADIESKPVLVLTSDEGNLDASFPSWNFNHMIVKASVTEKENYWLDPTSKYSPLGHLPPSCENINVLVLNPDYTSQIERTSGTKPEENFRDIALTLDLKEGGSAMFDVNIKYHGAINSSIRYNLEDKTDKEMKEYCKSLIADEFSNSEITDYELAEVDSVKSIYSLRFKGSAANLIQRQGDLLMVSSDPFKFFENTSWLVKDERELPIKFYYPFSIKKTIKINLPKGYQVRNLPDKLTRNTEDLDYTKDISKNENSITVSEKFKLKTSKIAAARYGKTKTFFESIKNKYGEKIILMKQG